MVLTTIILKKMSNYISTAISAKITYKGVKIRPGRLIYGRDESMDAFVHVLIGRLFI